MSDLTQHYLGRRGRVRKYECLIISHPNFTKTYRIVRNKIGGLTATFDGEETDFDFLPSRITEQPDHDDLDVGYKIDLGDVGEFATTETDAIEAADGWGTSPEVIYLAYSSDDLTTPLVGPEYLEILEFQPSEMGVSFVAQAPSMNANRTGELYLPSRFPMLRGLL